MSAEPSVKMEGGPRGFYATPAGLLLNFVFFQVGWFSCVLGGAWGYWWVGPLVVGCLLVCHLALSSQPRRELGVAGAAAALGFLVDTALIWLGIFRLESNPLILSMSAPWLVAMWVNFSLTLRYSMGWLRGRHGLAVLMGAIGGPIAYAGGERLGAIEITAGIPAFALLLAGTWAVATPLLMYWAWKEDD